MYNKCMLTTIDNPFDPFEQFTSWFLFDVEKGYNSCSLLGRIAKVSDQLSDEENDSEIERAIDEIIKFDYENIYKKVKQEFSVSIWKCSCITKTLTIIQHKENKKVWIMYDFSFKIYSLCCQNRKKL